MFFTGDNLEVLRHLQNNYDSSIDFIYIDPPYNTGSDGFIYPDNFEYSDEQLKNMFGIEDEELQRMKSIQKKSTHSSWLAFMYPRLYLAKKLLKDTGVIFVSIDDNEQADLKILMDEIFGENNFEGILVRRATATAKSTNGIGMIHDYIIVYGRSENTVKGLTSQSRNLKDEYFNERGYHDYGRLGRASLRYNPNQDYPIEIDGHVFYPGGDKTAYEKRKAGNHGEKDWQWRWTKPMWEVAWKNGFYANSNPKSGVINVKSYEKAKISRNNSGYFVEIIDSKTTNVNSIMLENGFLNQRGGSEIANLFDSNQVFSYPKPTSLPKFLLKLIQNKKAITLDFFAGSSTTADAVMQLNAEDGGNRQFIMCTLPERTYMTSSDGTEVPTKGGKTAYDAGYKSIDEISRERIRRASKKIKEEHPNLPDDFDGGFKNYFVTKPSQKALDEIESVDDTQMDMFDDMISLFSSDNLDVNGSASGFDTLLQTWLVNDGYQFDTNIEMIDFAGVQVPYVSGQRLYIISDKWNAESTKELVNAIGKNNLQVQTIVIYGYTIEMEKLRELEIALNQLENKVNLQERY